MSSQWGSGGAGGVGGGLLSRAFLPQASSRSAPPPPPPPSLPPLLPGLELGLGRVLLPKPSPQQQARALHTPLSSLLSPLSFAEAPALLHTGLLPRGSQPEALRRGGPWRTRTAAGGGRRPVSCEQSSGEAARPRLGDGCQLLLGGPSHQQEQDVPGRERGPRVPQPRLPDHRADRRAAAAARGELHLHAALPVRPGGQRAGALVLRLLHQAEPLLHLLPAPGGRRRGLPGQQGRAVRAERGRLPGRLRPVRGGGVPHPGALHLPGRREPAAGYQRRALPVGRLPRLVLAAAAQAPVGRGVRPALGPVAPGHQRPQLLLRVPGPPGLPGGLHAHGHLPGRPALPRLLPAHGAALPGPHPARGVPGPAAPAPALLQAQPRHPGRGVRLPRVLHLPGHRLVPLLGLPHPRPLPRVRHRPVHLRQQRRQARGVLPGREGQVPAAVGAAPRGLPARPAGRRRADRGCGRHAQHGHHGDAGPLGERLLREGRPEGRRGPQGPPPETLCRGPGPGGRPGARGQGGASASGPPRASFSRGRRLCERPRG